VDQVAKARRGRAAATAWRLRLRRRRLPGSYLASVLAAVVGLIAAPHAEELWALHQISNRGADRRQGGSGDPLAAAPSEPGVASSSIAAWRMDRC